MNHHRLHPSLPRTLLLLGCLLTLLTGPAQLMANGGTLRLANVPMGDYLVSVFTAPTPVRPDSLDVSVLILREGREGVAEGVEVTVRAESLDHGGRTAAFPATREQADDPRYYAAKFALEHEGRWRIIVEVEGDHGSGSASFELRAREAGIFSHPLVLSLLALLPLAALGWWVLREDDELEAPGKGGKSEDPGSAPDPGVGPDLSSGAHPGESGAG